MDKDAIKRRIDELMPRDEAEPADAEKAFHGAVSLLAMLYGPGSIQVKQLETARERMPVGYSPNIWLAAAESGALSSLRGEVDAAYLEVCAPESSVP